MISAVDADSDGTATDTAPQPIRSIAVTIEGSLNGRFHAGINCFGATQVTTPLIGKRLGQVARAAAAVHCLTRRGESKPLLRPLVGLDLTLRFALAHPSSLVDVTVGLVVRSFTNTER